jgi:arylsulfatase A-like enzyme
MMDPAPPSNPQPPSGGPSRLAILVVAGAILGFAILLVLANFTGGGGSPKAPNTDDPFAAFQSDNGKKAKSKGKAKAKAPPPRVDPASLLVQGPAVDRPAAPKDAKNVVLVTLTAVRKDALTPYGAPADRTPVLQDLASKGARFTDAISASPFSRQAAVAYLTGKYAAELGAVEAGEGVDESVVGNDVDTLAERLQAAGWRTYGVTGNQNVNTGVGLAQGFDWFRNAPPNGFAPGLRAEGDTLVPMALELLSKRSPEEAARPFYLQIDLIDAHAPLRVLKDVQDKFDPDQPNVAYRVAVYEADKYVGALVKGLEDAGYSLGKDTYLVVINDHGEGNEDPPHHGKMHGYTLYESVLDMPWIVVGPDVPPNRLIGGLASQVDVMPTVLGLVGVPAPDHLDGMSWAAQLKGQGDKTTRQRAFSDTWFMGAARAAIWTDTTECQKDYGSVGVDDTFATGCYDRRVDPQFTNLKQDAALQKELDDWRAEVTKNVKPPSPKKDEPVPATPTPEGEQAG